MATVTDKPVVGMVVPVPGVGHDPRGFVAVDRSPPGPALCPLDGCNEPVHHWFGLSYSSYLVIQRSLLEAMPIEWQAKLIALLEEARETFDTDKIPSEFMVRAKTGGRFVRDPFREYRRPEEIPRRAR
jgi:hypothetical protein